MRALTQNLYFGMNLYPLFLSRSVEELLGAVETAIEEYRASLPAARSAAVARIVFEERPDVVAVQEAASLVVDGEPVGDQLGSLLAELERLGRPHRVASACVHHEASAPRAGGGSATMAIQVALLVPEGATVSEAGSGLYRERLSVAHPVFGELTFSRGWASARVGGATVVATHLERAEPWFAQAYPVQAAQCAELLAGPASGEPLVLLGDFNSDATGRGSGTTPAYSELLRAGLADAWTAGEGEGLSWRCQDALHERGAGLCERLDLVLSRGFRPVLAWTRGGEPAAWLPAGVWPSDHLAVVADLEPVRADVS